MLLDSLNLKRESTQVCAAVDASLNEGMVTEDIDKDKSAGTSELGDWLAEWILKQPNS